MLNSQRYRTLIFLKGASVTFERTLSAPLLQHCPLPFSLHFCTSTSDSRSFAVSYFINKCGFSPESALKASKYVRFNTSKNPDSVLTFFRKHGFSDSNIYRIVRREPGLLSCKFNKRILPKFEFLLSKGAASSDIVRMVTTNPKILQRSLGNHIIPTFKLVHRFLKSDKKTIECIILHLSWLSYNLMTLNIKLLIDYGVADSNIARFLRARPSILTLKCLLKWVEEVKDLGFDPSKTTFSPALLAIKTVSKTRWDEKVDALKKWGWSDENVLEAFRKQPQYMLSSIDKLNAVMSFWVNQLGWCSLALVKGPNVFQLSLEKRIIPRASVVQFLLEKGLRKRNASLTMPFIISEALFLNKFVKCFKEDSSHLLKLYEEKQNHAYNTVIKRE